MPVGAGEGGAFETSSAEPEQGMGAVAAAPASLGVAVGFGEASFVQGGRVGPQGKVELSAAAPGTSPAEPPSSALPGDSFADDPVALSRAQRVSAKSRTPQR